VTVNRVVKALARAVLGEYSAYYIYACAATAPAVESRRDFRVEAITEASIASSQDPLIREQAFYAGSEAEAYACLMGSRVVGVCFYWYGSRYLKRNFWPLRDNEAKLVQIVSLPEFRGRGVARTLIEASFRAMAELGFHRAYARIWHSNVPSLRAFEHAGWSRIALVVEVNPLRRRQPLRICLRSPGSRTNRDDSPPLPPRLGTPR
jgi:RimJ/RimL family protein N-acetyltransferase